MSLAPASQDFLQLHSTLFSSAFPHSLLSSYRRFHPCRYLSLLPYAFTLHFKISQWVTEVNRTWPFWFNPDWKQGYQTHHIVSLTVLGTHNSLSGRNTLLYSEQVSSKAQDRNCNSLCQTNLTHLSICQGVLLSPRLLCCSTLTHGLGCLWQL